MEGVEDTLTSTQDQSGNTTKWWRNYPEQTTEQEWERTLKTSYTHRRTSFNTTCPHLQNRIWDVVDGVTVSEQAGGKDPPKKDPTTIKPQTHTESQHKRQPKTSKLRRSRRLYHWISQVFYHRSLHHKPRGSEQSNLRSRGSQEESHKQWEDKETVPKWKEKRKSQKQW